MKTQVEKDERIEIRVSSSDKRIFKKAQILSGDSSVSSFIVRVLKKEAEEIVNKHDKIIVSERDRLLFFDTVFNNSEPNKVLSEAAERYKSKKNSLL